MTTRWLRRAWLPLVAVVLLPLTLGVTFWNEWGGYYGTHPTAPVSVERGQEASFAGTGWRVAETSRIPADSAEGRVAGLPPASELISVVVEVSPDELVEGSSPLCTARLQQLQDGATVRSWNTATFSPIDYSPATELEWGCSPELTSDYLFEAYFVVPEGVGAELALNLEVSAELPRYLRLVL